MTDNLNLIQLAEVYAEPINPDRPTHFDKSILNGKKAYMMECNGVGYPMLFRVCYDNVSNEWHRIRTTDIVSIVRHGDTITYKTTHTNYSFTLLDEYVAQSELPEIQDYGF